MGKYEAYLMTHFVFIEQDADHEQVYMSVSKDGINWEFLNNRKCVLKSTIGEKGVRDPFCVRKADGSGYVILATNLSIYHRIQNTDDINKVWYNSRNHYPDNTMPASHDIIIWESDDLINWSEARAVTVGPENTGTAWAPKCIYDKKKNAYMIFFACTREENDYSDIQIYSCYTKDFKEFTPAKIWIDNSASGEGALDVSVVEEKGRYYRIYKSTTIVEETAEELDGKWERIETNIHSLCNKHEGPAPYKSNETGLWYVLLDCLHKETFGYELLKTADLASGVFEKEKVNFPDGIIYRHGSVMPITPDEYNRLKEKYE